MINKRKVLALLLIFTMFAGIFFFTPQTQAQEHPDENDVVIKIIGSAGSTIVEQVVTLAADNLKSIGIYAEPEFVDFNTLISQLITGEFQAAFFAWNLGLDPDHLYDFFATGAGLNEIIYRFHNSTYDEIVTKMMEAENRTEARYWAWEAQKILHQQEPLTVAYMNILLTPYRTDKFTGWYNYPGTGVPNYWTYLNVRFKNGSMGGTLVSSLGQPTDTLNILATDSAYSWTIFGLLYDSLYAFDPINNKDMGWLANNWTVEVINMTTYEMLKITFNLRHDVKWHDGKNFTAHDVKFTYDLVYNSQAPYMFSNIENLINVTVVDNYTVVIYDNKTGYFEFHRVAGLPILPKHIWEPILETELGGNATKILTYEPKAEELVGTGPFMVDADNYPIEAGQEINTLVKNPNFFRPANESWEGVTSGAIFLAGPWVDKIVFKVIEGEDQQVLAIKSGEIDLTDSFIDPNQLPTLLTNPAISVAQTDRRGFGHISFNSENFPTNITGFRVAFSQVFDKEKVSAEIFGGYSRTVDSPVPPSMGDWSYEDQFTTHYYTYDNASAIQTLHAWGFNDTDGDGWMEYDPDGDGVPVTLREVQPTGPQIDPLLIGAIVGVVVVVVIVAYFVTKKPKSA